MQILELLGLGVGPIQSPLYKQKLLTFLLFVCELKRKIGNIANDISNKYMRGSRKGKGPEIWLQMF